MTEKPHTAPIAHALRSPARYALQRALGPVERLLHVEAASGAVLLTAAVVALAWANSPWAASYARVWHSAVTVAAFGFALTKPVAFWINDGLMVLFFFVVGLEIRRDIHDGELSDGKRAALPFAAALGGMIAPALLFFTLNRGLPSAHGWGVPMATDIAFAVGVIALLGRRVPPALRLFLLALAVIDDIGAIAVIAVFYSSGVSAFGMVIVLASVAGILLMQHLGIRKALAYIPLGFVLWLGCLEARIHPTIAGVILGMLTPVRARVGESSFVPPSKSASEGPRCEPGAASDGNDERVNSFADSRHEHRESVPPVVRLQTALQPWVAFVIMPLFAIANAGVSVRSAALDAAAIPVISGVALGLLVGKPLGILTMSYVAVRVGVATLPQGVSWRNLAVVGCAAGIGFTMAIFIAGLAFEDPAGLVAAKLGVLLASLGAGVLALVAGRILLPLPAGDTAVIPPPPSGVPTKR